MWVTYGDTVVMATANMSDKPREGIDFFPLLVDYDEKYYAAGRIKGSRFMKREGKPADEAVLTARMIDRALRPLFHSREKRDVQVVLTVLSFDGENDADLPAFIAASLAVGVSDIPWDGPIGAVRLAKNTDTGEYVVNPEYTTREQSGYDVVVAGQGELINMIEAGLSEVPDEEIQEVLEYSSQEIQKIEELQKQIIEEQGKEKREFAKGEPHEETTKQVKDFARPQLEKAIFTPDPQEAQELLGKAEEEAEAFIEENISEEEHEDAFYALDKLKKEILREKVLEEKKRPDGRGFDEVRTLKAEAGFLPRPHGSGYFERGLTHTLSIATLGGPSEEEWLEGMEIVGRKRFMHHYNFPPFSVGEVKPMRHPSRREIGHGALAERALEPVIPSKEDFPYTVRVVTECISSNGSTSMASACSTTLSLMDAGIPITAPVAGVAMGIVYENPEKYAILTDIQGVEDFFGHMDFKIAGTENGITALQLDVKVPGLPVKALKEAIQQSKSGRRQVLETITGVLEEPRSELPEDAPRVLMVEVPEDKIREVIGPKGSVIQEITERTGAEVDIGDEGEAFVTADNGESAESAKKLIERIIQPLPVGTEFTGKVVSVVDFGVFVEIAPGKEGLVHISELSSKYVENAEDIVEPGEEITVKVIGYDKQDRPQLSLKAAGQQEE